MLSYYFDIIDKISKTVAFETISEGQFHTLFEDDYADIIDLLVEHGYIEVSGEVGERTLYITTKAIAEYFQEKHNRNMQEEARNSNKWALIIAIISAVIGIVSLMLTVV